MNPVTSYVHWAKNNPQKARSLENMSRVFCLMRSDVLDMVSAQNWWTLHKFHGYLNKSIIESDANPSLNQMINPVIGGLKLVESVVELTCRTKYGHKFTWDVLLALESLKSTLLFVVNRNLFALPCMWESIQQLLRRTFGFGKNDSLRPSIEGNVIGSPNATQPIIAQNAECSDSNNVSGGPSSPIPLVVPRVASSRLAEHNHTAMEITAGDKDKSSIKTMKASERFPMSWFDVLGMLIDVYSILRPLLLVAVGRHSFNRHHRLNSSEPLPIVPHQLIERAKAAIGLPVTPKGDSAPTKAGKSSPTPTLDSTAVVRALVDIPRQQSLFPDWKPWIVFLVVDIISALLARIVRSRRVPAVYIADEDLSSAPPALKDESDDEEEEEVEEGQSPEERAAVRASRRIQRQNNRGTTTTTSKAEEPTSQDDRRVAQCAKAIVSSALRDPFFSVGLRRWLYEKLMLKVFERIPLIGGIINYQMTYFLMMQHFCFTYSVDS